MPPGLIVGESAPLLDRDFVRQARSKPRVIAAVIVVVAALLLVLVLSQANNNDPLTAADLPISGPQPAATNTTSATTSTTPPTTVAVSTTAVTVLVDPNVLIGLKKDDAAAKLVALGLRVVAKEVKGHANAEKNTVVGVEPSGQVAPGSTVTLLIAGKR